MVALLKQHQNTKIKIMIFAFGDYETEQVAAN